MAIYQIKRKRPFDLLYKAQRTEIQENPMQRHADLGKQQVPGVMDLDALNDLLTSNSGCRITFFKKRPGWAERHRIDYFYLATVQSGKVMHSMLNKNGVVWLEMIWEKTSIY
jgi:hypothetical protein